MFRRLSMALTLGLACVAGTAATVAGEADVIKVEAIKESAGTYRFEVTVEHADEGWDHYADAWDVIAPDRSILGTRTLLHPHENEQPFTRSLGGVAIPEGIASVTIRARDSVHGYGGIPIEVALPDE